MFEGHRRGESAYACSITVSYFIAHQVQGWVRAHWLRPLVKLHPCGKEKHAAFPEILLMRVLRLPESIVAFTRILVPLSRILKEKSSHNILKGRIWNLETGPEY